MGGIKKLVGLSSCRVLMVVGLSSYRVNNDNYDNKDNNDNNDNNYSQLQITHHINHPPIITHHPFGLVIEV